ncbi:TetR-like C-terminal domain-containing protein [Streptomyces sp. AK08-02]|uniref:TetR-like C-terminal domain-containing protein n=1 Tax=Streptomyces TaxID=1883 RepID=UPI0039F55110
MQSTTGRQGLVTADPAGEPSPAEGTPDKGAEALVQPERHQLPVREWAPCVQQAVDRGEVPEGTDDHEVIRAVSAPLYYRLLTTGDRLDEAAADQAAETAAAAARAGKYVRG